MKRMTYGALVSAALSLAACSTQSPKSGTQTAPVVADSDGNSQTSGCQITAAQLAAYPLSVDGLMTACSLATSVSGFTGSGSSYQPTHMEATLDCTGGADASLHCGMVLDAASNSAEFPPGTYTQGGTPQSLTPDACSAYLQRAAYICSLQPEN